MMRLLSLLVAAVAIWGGCAVQQRPAWRSIAISDSWLVADEPRPSEDTADLARRASRQAVEERGDGMVAENEVWTTIIDFRDPRDPRIGSYQGTESVYPASVIKLCYMVAAFDQVYTQRLEMTADLRDDLYKMIVFSDNQATNRILDRLTNTAFGPELEGSAKTSFEVKRQTVTRYMQRLGLSGLWAANKTYDENVPLYGRDVQWLGKPEGDNYQRSNMMTTDDTARLLYLIWRHGVVDYDACEEMLALLRRGEESRTFFKEAAPEGVTLYSKGGSTDLCRHDAGIFELPDGGAVIIVSFSKTRNVRDAPPQVIERVAEIIMREMMETDGELDQATADK